MQFRHPVTRRARSQHGYALLFVFFLAGSISIMLMSQMPRVAFETQRDREQMLVDRGEQFKRAIQMYYVKTKKFPQRIEDLENTNNVRFLRRRYIDPMTGKDEWRIIHVNAAGLLTDSLIEKAPGLDPTKDKDKTELASANPANPADAAPDLNTFAKQRPSDRMPGGLPSGAQIIPGADPNAPPSSFADPNQPANPGAPPNPPGYQFPGAANPAQPGAPGIPQPFQPGQQIAGPTGITSLPGTLPSAPLSGGYPGAPSNSQTGGVSPFQPGTQPFQPGAAPFPQPGIQMTGAPQGTFGPGGAPPNQAINMINQIITTPRQNPNAPTSSAPTQSQFGAGGIAGFASTYTGTGIKLYKDRKKYQEWEFVFDLKEMLGQQQKGGIPANNNNPLGRPATPGSGPQPGRTSTPDGFTIGGSSTPRP